ncbi:MAG: hypothetical protein AB1351_00140 [Thermoproteota archaeon]
MVWLYVQDIEKRHGTTYRNIECKICKRQFQSEAELDQHKIIEHQRNHPPLGVG